MDHDNEAAPKVVDFNTAKRRHYDKCTSVMKHNNTVILNFATREPYEYAPGGAVEEVLLVRQRISLAYDEARDLYAMLREALYEAGSGQRAAADPGPPAA